MRNTRIVVPAAVVAWLLSSAAAAQTGRTGTSGRHLSVRAPSTQNRVVQARFDNNPITRWASAQDGESMIPTQQAAPSVMTPRPAAPRQAAPPIYLDNESIPHAEAVGPMHGSFATSGDCHDCGPAGPCEHCEMPYRGRGPSIWNAGFAFTFVQPRFSDNVALSITEGNTNSSAVTETSFDYEIELSPRVWLERGGANSLGWRILWWQLDQDADQVFADAPGNGLGIVAPPEFRDIDISVNLPGETLQADSHVRLYAIDFEATRRIDFDCWSLLAAGGLRHASVDQDYRAVATNANGVQSGSIEQNRSLDGIGPTFLIEALRPVSPRMTVFSNARASLLFGDGETTLTAGEDLDLASAFTTTRTSENDDLLPILEAQLGMNWCTAITPCHDFTFTAALEGQWWSGVGTASDDNGDLGLFGFVVGFGLQY